MRPKTLFTTVLAVVCCASSLVAVLGWYLRVPTLVQVAFGLTPMMANCGLNFFFMGTALLGLSAQRAALVRVSSLLVLIVAGATVVEYLCGIDLVLDTLLVEPFLPIGALHPGRMGLNTATVMILDGLALLSLSWPPDRQGGIVYFPPAVGAVTVAMGSAGLLGHVVKLPFVAGWNQLSGMALLTAVLFVVVGMALMVLSLPSGATLATANKRLLYPLSVGLVSALAGFTLWQGVVNTTRKTSSDLAKAALEERTATIQAMLAANVHSLSRISRQWASLSDLKPSVWAADAASFLADAPFIEAMQVLSKDGAAKVVIPTADAAWYTAEAWAKVPEMRRAIAAVLATRRHVLTPSLELPRGGRGFTFVTPLLTNDEVSGLLIVVFPYDRVFASLRSQAAFAGLDISDGDTPVDGATRPSKTRLTSTLTVEGRSWQVSGDYLDAASPLMNFSLFILIFAFCLTIALVAIVYFAVLARIDRDLAAEKSLENARLNEHFKNVVDLLPLGYIETTGDGAITYVNRYLLELSGYSQDEWLDFNWQGFVEAPDQIKIDYDRSHAQGPVGQSQHQIRFRCKDGRRLWIATTSRHMPLVDGQFTGRISCVEDVTERIERDRRLAFASDIDRLLLAHDQTGAMIAAVLNSTGAYLGWAWGQAWGLGDTPGTAGYVGSWKGAVSSVDFSALICDPAATGPACLAGQAWRDRRVVWCPDIAAADSFQRTAAARAAGLKAGLAIPLGSGEQVLGVMEFFSASSSPLDGSWIEPLRTVGLRVGEALLRLKTKAELARANTALKAASDELTRSNLDLEQFAYVASHDLKAPLRHVRAYAELLAEKLQLASTSEAGELIGHMTKGIGRMDRLISDLLDYSSVGRRGDVLQDVDLGALARDLVEHTFPPTDAYQVEVGALPTVLGQATQLHQLLQNLIANGIKFCRPGHPAKVTLSCQDQPGEWVLAVQDNGIGIDQKYLTKIFQVFYRLHDKRHFDGTGIGLAICKRVAETHGGRIWVESQLGVGTTFFVALRKSAAKPALAQAG